MQRFVLWLITMAAGVWIAILLVPGISLIGVESGALPDLSTLGDLLLVTLILGVVNATIGPILKILAFPITCLTLGLFMFVINALMLLLTAFIAQQFNLEFVVAGILPALLGAIVISVVNTILSLLVSE
jgi:putative membrane protein